MRPVPRRDGAVGTRPGVFWTTRIGDGARAADASVAEITVVPGPAALESAPDPGRSLELCSFRRLQLPFSTRPRRPLLLSHLILALFAHA